MVTTAKKALELLASKTKVRPIEVAELAASSSVPGLIKPKDILGAVVNTVGDYYGTVQRINAPRILASHLEIASIDGEEVSVNPEESNPSTTALSGFDPNQELEITLKYNRIQCYIPLGIESELVDCLAFTYSLDKNKFILTAGKMLAVSEGYSVFGTEFIWRGNGQNIGSAITALQEYLERFIDYSHDFSENLNRMKAHWMDVENINKMFTDHHYISALYSKGDRKGTKQIFSDAVMKSAHLLLYGTIHPYRLENQSSGGTVYQVYNCFVEALHENNADLINTFERHLLAYHYFEENWLTYDNALVK